MKKFDCIIVGAGPSGIAAAKVLSDNNINYCIIEKYKFPRNKLCGGGLTNKTIKLLNKLDININSINKIKLNKLVFISKGIRKN